MAAGRGQRGGGDFFGRGEMFRGKLLAKISKTIWFLKKVKKF